LAPGVSGPIEARTCPPRLPNVPTRTFPKAVGTPSPGWFKLPLTEAHLRSYRALFSGPGGMRFYSGMCTYLASQFATDLLYPTHIVKEDSAWFFCVKMSWRTKMYTHYFVFVWIPGLFVCWWILKSCLRRMELLQNRTNLLSVWGFSRPVMGCVLLF